MRLAAKIKALILSVVSALQWLAAPIIMHARLSYRLRQAGASWREALVIPTTIPASLMGGSTWINDLKNNVVVGMSVCAAIAANTNGAAVDLLEGEGNCFLIVFVGTVTDGTYQVTVEEADTSGGSYTAVSLLGGVVPDFTSAADERAVIRTFKRSKRFVRAVVTETAAGTTGGLFGIGFATMKKSVQ